MSLTEPHMAVSLCSSLSLNDLPAHCSRPDLNRSMSLPSAKKRLRFFRRDSLKRRKTAHDEVPVRLGDDSVSPSVVSPEAIVNKDQSTVPAVRRPPSPTRRKLENLLSRTSKLLSLTTYRNDSVVLTSKDTRKGRKRALEDANRMIAGPNGETLPPYVVDDFFKLYSDGGSAWQQSWQWEVHLDRWEGHKTHRFVGNRVCCAYCRELALKGHELPPPFVPLSPPASFRSSSFDQDSSSEPRESEDSHLSITLWPPGIRRRIEKGKDPARDDTCCDAPHVSVSHRTEVSEQQLVPPRARASDEELVRCSISGKPIDPHQRSIPTARNPSKERADLDLSGPFYLPGCPYGSSFFQRERSPVPLSKNLRPPLAPELKPAQRRTPVPGSFKLEEPTEPTSNTPLPESNPNATRVIRGGFCGSITLVPASSTTAQSAIKELLSQCQDTPSSAKLQKRRPRYHSPSPDFNRLPTPPDSRNNSDSHESIVAGVPEVTFGDTGSLPARPAGPRRRTTGTASTIGPADRDSRVCTLSDTTGSPSPECPMYVNTREKKTLKNEEARKKQWPGMRLWRYRTESEDEA